MKVAHTYTFEVLHTCDSGEKIGRFSLVFLSRFRMVHGRFNLNENPQKHTTFIADLISTQRTNLQLPRKLLGYNTVVTREIRYITANHMLV